MNAISRRSHLNSWRQRTRLFLAGTMLLVAAPAHAAFNAAVSYATGVQPIGIATADFNGDGKLDLVTANSNNNGNGTVSVLLGNGNGTFGAHNDLDASAGSASSVAVGDLDGDGKPDIVVGKNGTAIRVFINTGGGTFAPAVPYITGSQPYALGLADLNGDGFLDIVTANLNSDDMSVLINQGAGTFLVSAPIAVGNAPSGLVLNDFNADGRVDVAIVRQAPAGLTVFLGNGDGTFASALNQVLSGAPRAVVAGDFNADGKMDLAVANDSSPGGADVLLGSGNGTFAAATSYATGAFPRSLAVAEFNGDGKVDLALPSTSTANVDVLSGTGTGTFGAASPNSVGASANPNGIVVGDFNGDGKPDMATSNYGLNTVSVMLNNSAAFSPAITVDDIRVTEGDSGTINATFSIRLSHASASTVSLNAVTASGSALSGLDFTGIASTPVSFSPGVTSQVVNVLVKGDTTDEPAETFLLKLSGAANGYILDPIGVCTILDNDGPPTIKISSAKVVEGDAGVSSATFTISLSASSGNTVSVQYASADGTGNNAATVADGDFFQATGSVSFAPGVVTQTASVTVQGDSKMEPNETLRLILSNPVNATIATPTGIGTIIDDDGPNIFATKYTIGSENCGAGSGALDPGETATLSVTLRNFSPVSTSSLNATLLNTGGVTNASGAQNYGVLSPAGPSAARNFTFTVDPTLNAGDVVTLTFALQDNGATLPPATMTIVLSQREPLRENFDSVAATALPSGWDGHISVGVAGDSAWRTIAVQAESLPNAAFGPSQAHVTDNALTSPAFPVTTSSAKLTFRNSYNFEDGFDGATLEIAVNGSAFMDILSAGGTFTAGGYNKVLSNSFSNPIGGRQAWTGNSGGFITTSVNLPSNLAGKNVQLRWHLGTDTSTSATGQFVDDILVMDGTSAMTCACSVQCPANIVVPNDPGQCGAVVNFPSSTITGGCGTTLTTPSSGSFFPIGVTTVTTSAAAGSACSFTVTVQDTQKVCGEGAAVNVSTRLPVGAGDDALIEGFIVQGPVGSTKKMLIRAIGPSLLPFGIADALANPTLEIHNSSTATIATNNDWKNTQLGGLISSDQFAEINGSGVAPSNDLESAIIADLAPGSYTAVVRGAGNTIGTGVVDAYDISSVSPARLVNVATRGVIQPGDKLMIAGFIVQNGPAKAVVRAIGPSLLAFGINNALPDTTLQLRDQNGAIVRENDDWMSDQQAELEATGLQPSNVLEAALIQTIPPGQYTAQVRGKPETTGIGVVEIYFLP